MVPVVVIPVLNRYDLLERCIDSLDFPVDKIIIIDNGGKIEAGLFGDATPQSARQDIHHGHAKQILVLRLRGILASR
jgi:hypothetical protein